MATILLFQKWFLVSQFYFEHINATFQSIDKITIYVCDALFTTYWTRFLRQLKVSHAFGKYIGTWSLIWKMLHIPIRSVQLANLLMT